MNVISRRQWKARSPRAAPINLGWDKIDSIVVHYSSAYSDEEPDYAARVRGIQNFHLDSRGWNDIAYNFLFSRDGSIFEGRGWEKMSAATLGHNDHTVAFCFLGTDKVDRDDVTKKGRTALTALIQEAMHRKHVHSPHSMLRISGHRDWVQTECPGAELYHLIQTGGWRMKPEATEKYPVRFFQWAAWYLGEGAFAADGPRKGPRPKVAYPVTPAYWIALRRFLRARKRA